MKEVTKTKAQLVAEVTRLGTHAAEHETAANRERGLRESLQASETRYRRLFEAAQDGILILDAGSGEIVAVNPFLANLLGYPPQDLVGRKLWDVGAFRNVLPSPIAFKDWQENACVRYDGLPLETAAGQTIAVEFVRTAYQVDREKVIQCNVRDISDRKRVEEKVRLQNMALEAAATAIVITDRDGLIEWVNPAFSTLTGYSAGEALGRNPRDLVKSGRQDPAFYQRLWETIVAGRVWRGELINRRKDGTVYTEEQVITPVRDAAGEIRHFIAVKQDITDRKRADAETRARAQLLMLRGAVEVALRSNESLVAALQQCADAIVEHLSAGAARIWTLDAAAGVLELQACAGLAKEADGARCRVPVGQSGIGRIVEERTPYVTDAAVGDPRVGDQPWVARHALAAFAAQPLIADGRVVGVLALFSQQPLSAPVVNTLAFLADRIAGGIDRHREADARRIAEERIRFALQVANVGVWELNLSTGAFLCSDEMFTQLGVEREAFGGTWEAFVELVHPDDRAIVLEARQRTDAAGGELSVVHRIVRPDGTVRWLRGMGRIILDGHGHPARAVGISLDVTDLHVLEIQFQQAQKMEAVGRLAGGVAHDFNNLLTSILGYSELLLADLGPGDPHRSDVAEIQKAGVMAASLTRQLLAFSRQEPVARSVLDLNVVVGEMQSMLERLIGEDIEVVLRLSDRPVRVNADRGQMEQVVMNLAVNARDAMPGGGRLTIATDRVDLDDTYAAAHVALARGTYVALTVIDSGTGMTPEVQAHLFEPFFTTKAVGKGTGLGLATVHGIVQQNGGSIDVHSEVGLGSSFTVFLPPADADAPVAEAAPGAPRRPSAPCTALVVDDAEGLRTLTRRMLEHAGYVVLTASSAAEALQIAAAHPEIGVLVTDVVMPGASGPELVVELLKRTPDMRVVYMSGYTDEALSHRRVLEPGIVLLNKPFTAAQLRRALRDVLGA